MTTPQPTPHATITSLQSKIAETRTLAEKKAQQAITYKDTHDDFTPEGHILSREPANTEKIGSAALMDYFQQAKFIIPTDEF